MRFSTLAFVALPLTSVLATPLPQPGVGGAIGDVLNYIESAYANVAGKATSTAKGTTTTKATTTGTTTTAPTVTPVTTPTTTATITATTTGTTLAATATGELFSVLEGALDDIADKFGLSTTFVNDILNFVHGLV